jgi:dTDP-4-dehydrorhamnose reductase
MNFNQMKRSVLITGSNGFIGQKLLDQVLQDKSLELIALSKGPNRYPKASDFVYVQGDVCDAKQMRALVERYRPDVIIHTVAMANVETCEEHVQACAQVNVEPVRALIALAQEFGIHLIHLSTDFVFDGENGPYQEDDPINPLNEYGRSKAEAERLLQESAIPWTIVRTILVYGTPHDPNRSNLILWVKRSLEAGKEINVVTDHYRMPTLVEDLAGAILKMIEKKATGIFHISGQDGYSIHELAKEVAGFWRLDASLIKPVVAASIPSGVPRPSHTGFKLDKAQQELDFVPRSLREGFQLMQEQFLK